MLLGSVLGAVGCLFSSQLSYRLNDLVSLIGTTPGKGVTLPDRYDTLVFMIMIYVS